MRTYEALFICRPELGDEDIQTVVNKTETLIKDNGGTIVRSEVWGKRRLAYEVKKLTEGIYVLVRFEADPSFVEKLENYFRLEDNVIRYLVVHFDEKTLRLEAEQLRRKEADIKSSALRRESDDDDDDDDDDAPRRRRPRRVVNDDDDDDDEDE